MGNKIAGLDANMPNNSIAWGTHASIVAWSAAMRGEESACEMKEAGGVIPRPSCALEYTINSNSTVT